ncbi:MAG: hypothetical protein ACYSOG_05235 [Planctomycetota bacterium]|jgi:hypothetical protein
MEQYNQNNDPFDQLLASALQKHTEPIRPGFRDKVLHKIDHFEEQKLLRRVVVEGRIVFGSCIVFAMCALTALILYAKEIAGVLTDCLNAAAQTSFSFSPNWEWVLLAAVAIVSVMYASYDSLGLKRLLASKMFR